MKTRSALVSNSSSSSFIVNTMMYSGLVVFPFLFGYITYRNREAIRTAYRFIKSKLKTLKIS